MPYNKNILGHMTESELAVIESWASSVPEHGVIVEIGTFFGRSAVCWAMTADKSVQIYCGDVWPDSFALNSYNYKTLWYEPKANYNYNLWQDFKDNTEEFSNIIPMRGLCPQGITYPGNPIDIFFLDAAHTNPSDWENIEYFLPFIKSTGMICGHDYSTNWPDVVENVHRLEKLLNRKATIYPNGYLWSISMSDSENIILDESALQEKIYKSRAGGGILKRRNQ